jgi:methyl-accepting chemotaxis protein
MKQMRLKYKQLPILWQVSLFLAATLLLWVIIFFVVQHHRHQLLQLEQLTEWTATQRVKLYTLNHAMEEDLTTDQGTQLIGTARSLAEASEKLATTGKLEGIKGTIRQPAILEAAHQLHQHTLELHLQLRALFVQAEPATQGNSFGDWGTSDLEEEAPEEAEYEEEEDASLENEWGGSSDNVPENEDFFFVPINYQEPSAVEETPQGYTYFTSPDLAKIEIPLVASRTIKAYQELNNQIGYARESAHNQLFWAFVTGILLQIILSVFAFFVWQKHLFRPLQYLGEQTHQLAQGQSDKKIKLGKKTELGRLSQDINLLVGQMQSATHFVKTIEAGDLNTQFDQGQASFALAKALTNMQESMQRIAREDAQRNWATQGLAKFVDILRNSYQNLNELGDAILSNLIDYTKANQGGLYILHDEDANNLQLELVACYAFGKKKFRKNLIEPGEGLLGQAFIEGQTMNLLEIPDDYLSISSGLGGARPKNLLIVPLSVNGEIYGMIELASFNSFARHEIDFIEKLAESIASTLAAEKTNSRTRQLLQESQEMTEQMRAQEEEMRQNMEELAATQEEMARKEAELAGQLEAMNQNLLVAQLDASGKIIQGNQLLADAFNQPMENLKGTPLVRHIELLSGSLENAFAGQKVKIAFSTDNGQQYEGSLTPVNNRNGVGMTVIMLADEGTNLAPLAHPQDPVLHELEHQLRIQMEALEITQEELNKKLG